MELAGILGAFGLSGAAGLNAYIPLLLIASLGRLGVFQVHGPFEVITHTWSLVLLSVLLVVELIVDKVPGADHVNDVVQTFVRPTAGAILFASSAGILTNLHPAIPLAAGLLVAFGVHAAKVVARPAVNAATVGVGAPIVSLAEDALSLGTSLAAVFLPALVLVFVLLFAFVAYKLWARRRGRRGAPVT